MGGGGMTENRLNRRGTYRFGRGSCVTGGSTPLIRGVRVAVIVVGHLTSTLVSNLLCLQRKNSMWSNMDSNFIPVHPYQVITHKPVSAMMELAVTYTKSV